MLALRGWWSRTRARLRKGMRACSLWSCSSPLAVVMTSSATQSWSNMHALSCVRSTTAHIIQDDEGARLLTGPAELTALHC